MKLEDIIALAKNGYKPNDIKELIELSKVEDVEVADQGEAPEDAAESEQTTQTISNPTDTAETSETIDYRKLYEEEHSKLLNAQKANLSLNMSGSINSDEETLQELFQNLK